MALVEPTDPVFTLRWPREVFWGELGELSDDSNHPYGVDESAVQLLREAFWAEEVVDQYANQDWLEGPEGRSWFRKELLSKVGQLRERGEKPYYHQRVNKLLDVTASVMSKEDLTDAWLGLVAELERWGYFDHAAPRSCALDAVQLGPPAERLRRQLRAATGADVSWPLHPDDVEASEDLFLTLVEAVGEMVARPRRRSLDRDRDPGCGWHYSCYSTITGQRLYQTQANRLLAAAGMDLRLAEDGDDHGRLVRITGDARDELVEKVLATTPEAVDERKLAIALFRDRDAGVPERRSAIVILVGILEQRRALLEERLFQKDEGAIFDVANKFNLRHRKLDQKRHYDGVFLNWIFWWYLATIELTDRLIARQEGSPAS